MAFRENYSREMPFPEGKLFPSAGIGNVHVPQVKERVHVNQNGEAPD
jgi:hypothetical protein